MRHIVPPTTAEEDFFLKSYSITDHFQQQLYRVFSVTKTKTKQQF